VANDESILREVDQELTEERLWTRFREQGPRYIAAAVVLIAFVGGWQFWKANKERAAAKSAVEFRDAAAQLETSPVDGRAALSAFSEEASAGYSVLADLRLAASLAEGGERLSALDAYRKVYGNNGASKRLAQIARIRAAMLSLDDGRDEVIRDLGDLESDATAIGFYARELAGVAALNAGDYETAKGIFERAVINLDAPSPVRRRAEEFAALASAGKAGVSLDRSLNVDDLTQSLNGVVDAEGESHEGHDHEEREAEVPEPDLVQGEALPNDEPSAGADDNPEQNL